MVNEQFPGSTYVGIHSTGKRTPKHTLDWFCACTKQTTTELGINEWEKLLKLKKYLQIYIIAV